MKVLVGANDPLQCKHGTDWLEYHSTLKELERWATQQEGTWGECFIFLEITLPAPQSGKVNNQLDLIVCFDSRAVICEMKRSPYRRLDVPAVLSQLEGQERTFKEFVKREKHGGDFSQVLFLPEFGRSEMALLYRRLLHVHSRHHIQIAGCRSELWDRADDGHLYHVIDVLDRCLSRRELDRHNDHSPLQEHLRMFLTDPPRSLRIYDTVADTIQALRSFSPAPHILFPSGFIENARPREFQTALGVLQRTHILELVGPEAIGKTVLAKEIMKSLTWPVLEHRFGEDIRVGRRSTEPISAEDIGRSLERHQMGVIDIRLPDSSVPARLAGEKVIYWISYVHDDFRVGLSAFMDGVLRLDSVGNAYWIIESRAGLDTCRGNRVDVGSMERDVLARILKRIKPGGLLRDPEDAIDRSYGNPGTALLVWTATNRLEQRPRAFGWFDNQLNSLAEKRALQAVCYAMANAPLGLSLTLLMQFSRAALSDFPASTIERAVARVLSALRDDQLADITSFNRQHFGGLLNDIVPESANLTIVHSVDDRLLHASLSALERDRTQRLSQVLERVLIEAAETGNLAESTYEIVFGRNLEAFLRSSFRFTSLGRVVIDWIESRGFDHGDNPTQCYLLRSLRVLAALNRDRAVNVREELGPPDTNDPVQVFAYEFVMARQLTVLKNATSLDLTVLEKIHRIPDLDLRVAGYMGVATALANAGRSTDAWTTLTSNITGFDVHSTAEALLHFQIANFVNTKDGKETANHGSVCAMDWTARCSKLLVEAGLRCENIHLISAGLFYYVRAEEMEVGRDEFQSVLRYLSIFEWIEQVPLSRTRWRMRTLLTKGSIHRHFLRQEALGWDVFSIHLDLAWAHYSRAFNSAHIARHSMHALNALTYTTKLCLSALRLSAAPEASRTIAKYVEEVLVMCKLARQDLTKDGEKEIPMWSNIERSETLLTFFLYVGFPDSLPDLNEGEVRRHWAKYVDSVITLSVHREHKALDESCKSLRRVLKATSAAFPTRHNLAIGAIRPEVERLVGAMKPRSGRPIKPAWSALLEYLPKSQLAAQS